MEIFSKFLTVPCVSALALRSNRHEWFPTETPLISPSMHFSPYCIVPYNFYLKWLLLSGEKLPRSFTIPYDFATKRGASLWIPLFFGRDSWTRTSEMQESKSCALTDLAISLCNNGIIAQKYGTVNPLSNAFSNVSLKRHAMTQKSARKPI